MTKSIDTIVISSEQNTTTEMRQCVGCKNSMSIDSFEKNKKGVLFKNCKDCRSIDKDMEKYYGGCIMKITKNN